MKKYKVVFLQSALDDLEGIVLYISQDSKANALKMHHKILQLADKLETFPKLGPQVPEKQMAQRGLRVITIENYLIFYKVCTKEVSILRVLHGARDYPGLLSRL